MTQTIIDLMRHGEPEGGRAYRGNGIDDPLSEKGWQQMWDAVTGHAPWDHIVSSPMKRCLDFAEALTEKHAITLSIEDDLREIGFGCWEGRTAEQIKKDNLSEYERFYADPVNNRPSGAEALPQFSSRVGLVIDRLVGQYNGKHVLVVAHAGVIRAIVVKALQSPLESMFRIRSDYAAFSRLNYVNNSYHIIFHNSQLHD